MVPRKQKAVVVRRVQTECLDLRSFRCLYDLAQEAGQRLSIEDFVRDIQQRKRLAVIYDQSSGEVLGYCDRLDQVKAAGAIIRRAEKLFELSVIHRLEVDRGSLRRACTQFAVLQFGADLMALILQRLSGREREPLRAG